MAQTIDIDDLTNPVLTPMQRAAVDAAEAHPVPLDEQAVLDAACRRQTCRTSVRTIFALASGSGWPRRGPIAHLTELGRAMIYGMAVTYARNRLRIEDIVKRHPEILDIPIERPLVVAGLPRSGTTHLQNFLSADPRLRELPMWESTVPGARTGGCSVRA